MEKLLFKKAKYRNFVIRKKTNTQERGLNYTNIKSLFKRNIYVLMLERVYIIPTRFSQNESTKIRTLQTSRKTLQLLCFILQFFVRKLRTLSIIFYHSLTQSFVGDNYKKFQSNIFSQFDTTFCKKQLKEILVLYFITVQYSLL